MIIQSALHMKDVTFNLVGGIKEDIVYYDNYIKKLF